MKYTKRKDGLYSAYITVGKTVEGKPKRKYVYGKSINEVDKKLTELKMMYHKGIALENETMTFQQLGELWFSINKSTKEYNTKDSIRRILKNHIYPTLGHLPIKYIKAYHIQELVNNKLQSGLTDTTRKMLNYIKSILNMAVDNDFVLKNVANSIKIPKFKAKEKKLLSSFEKEVIEAVAKTHKHGDMILTFMYTGMRREELIPLCKKDINLNDSTISINKAIYFNPNQAVLKTTKNKEVRIIPLLDKIRPILDSRCNECDNYLFPMSNGEMMSQTSFREAIASFKKECNIYIDKLNEISEEKHPHLNFTAHALRHNFCSFLYYANIGVKEAQEIMGHHSIKMTLDLYTHLDNERQKISTEKLNNYINSL